MVEIAPRTVGLLAVLAALAVTLSLGGVASGETVEDVTIEIEETDLVVTADQDAIPDDEANVTVRANTTGVVDGYEVEPNSMDDDPFRYEIPIGEFDVDDLSNVTVSVHSGGDEIATRSEMDLRYVELDGTPRLDDGLVIPTADAVGVHEGDDVLLREDEDGEISLSAEYDDDELRIGEYRELVEKYREADALDVDIPIVGIGEPADGVHAVGTTELNLRDADDPSLAVESTERLTIESALLFADDEYLIAAETTDPDGTYLTTETADDGSITVENADLLRAESVTVTVYHGGVRVATATENLTTDPVEATIEAGGSEIAVSDGLTEDGTVETLAIGFDGEEGEQIETVANVSYEGGTIDLSTASVALAENGSYQLVATLDDGSVLRAEIDGNDGGESAVEPTAVGAEAEDETMLSMLPISTEMAAGVVGGLLLVGGVVVGARRWEARDASVEIELVDEETDESIEADATVTLTPADDGDRIEREIEIDGGARTTELPAGRWTAATAGATGRSLQIGRFALSESIAVPVPPQNEGFTVVDAGQSDRPIADATVSYETDDGESGTERTDQNGRFTLELPQGVNVSEVTISHDRYESATLRADTLEDANQLTLSPKTGEIAVTARLDGESTAGLNVGVKSNSGLVSDRASERVIETTETNARGEARFDGLVIGEYEVVATVADAEHVPRRSTSVALSGGDVENPELHLPFEFELADRQRQEIDRLRAEIDELTGVRRDVAIPRYYGSVFEELLSLVERLPEHGPAFVRTGVDPERLADAVLDAAADGIERTAEAMTTKQNVDLFGACSTMRDVRIERSNTFDVDELFDRLDRSPTEQRRELGARRDEVDDRVASERRNVSTIAPAREQIDAVSASLRSTPDDELGKVVQLYVALGVLDAIEELFEHPELVDRLDRTVF